MCCINNQITKFLTNHFHSGQKRCDADLPGHRCALSIVPYMEMTRDKKKGVLNET